MGVAERILDMAARNNGTVASAQIAAQEFIVVTLLP